MANATKVTHTIGGGGGAKGTLYGVTQFGVRTSNTNILYGFNLNGTWYGGTSGTDGDVLTIPNGYYIWDIEYGTSNSGAGQECLSALRITCYNTETDKYEVYPSKTTQYGNGLLSSSVVCDEYGLTYPVPSKSTLSGDINIRSIMAGIAEDIFTDNQAFAASNYNDYFDVVNGNNILVTAIGVNAGSYLDALQVALVKSFQPSTLATEPEGETEVYAVIGSILPGGKLTTYTQQVDQKVHAFSQSETQSNSVSVTASVEGEYFVKASMSTTVGFEYSKTDSISSQFSSTLTSAVTKEQEVPAGYVAVLLCTSGQVFKVASMTDKGVFIPNDTCEPFTVELTLGSDGIENNMYLVEGYYDLNKYTISVPGLTLRKEAATGMEMIELP
ncbi:MAG: hypothetical protein AAGP08_07730 [Pseudomonadota bacterium]